MKVSLGFILAISLAGLQFLAIIVVVSTSYVSSERAMLDHARDLLAEAGENASEQSNGFLQPAREAAELSKRVIESGVVPDGDYALLETFLFQALQNAPQISGLYYGSAEGDFVYVMRSDGPGPFRTKIMTTQAGQRIAEFVWRSTEFAPVETATDPDDPFDPRTRPWYKLAEAQRKTIWTSPYIFFSSQRPGISVAAPVMKDGALKGVIGVDIEIAAISGFLSQLSISDSGSALILNDNGDVIAHPDLEQIIVRDEDATLSFVGISEIEDPLARAAFVDLAASGMVEVARDTQSAFEYEGARYVSLARPLMGTDLPWTIALYAPETAFTQSIKDNRRNNIWLAAGISFLTAIAGLVIAELILKPVRAFAVRTALVSQGEVPTTEPLPRTYNELKNANETLIGEIAQRREADAKISELSRDLSHFSRVNLMGQMATGLAHELSQPLTAISQNADAALTTARQNHPDDTDLQDILSELDEQAHRGGDILRALRGFVRKDESEIHPFDFNELLVQTDRLLLHEAEAQGIKLTLDAGKLPMVVGNRIQIAQVLTNLIRNAIEAITEADSPVKTITLTAHPKDDSLEVWVEDSGPGVAPDVTLFKQFETSKKDGMGLGLSICRTIAEANNGRLWFDADHSPGARFCLTLPIQSSVA